MSVVLIAPEDAKDIILIDHPRTSQPCQFLLTGSDKLYEILTLKSPNKQSLLLEDEIIASAPIHIASAFDVTFVLIAGLLKSSHQERFVEPDELLQPFPRTLRPALLSRLPKLCDSVEEGEGHFWRLSNEKTQNYVQARIARVKAALPITILNTLPTADDLVVDLAKQKAALELVSSYLPPSLSSRISDLYDFSALSEHLTSLKSEVIDANEFIKRKAESDEPGAVKKAKKGSKGVEALKKANTRGMKSMTSFFTKKEKVG